MRRNVRFLAFAVVIQTILVFAVWKALQLHSSQRLVQGKSDVTDIMCDINGEYEVKCKRRAFEIYVPFTFLKRYFDIYGKVVKREGVEHFSWSHSYANVYHPTSKYDPMGAFAHFQHYKVEERERIKCISAIHGVPVSTQWNPQGHFYPTQIAQFALSHYSKNISEEGTKKVIVEMGGNWRGIGSYKIKGGIFEFQGHLKAAIREPFLILNADVKLAPDGDITVVIEEIGSKHPQRWYMHYVVSQECVWMRDNHVYHGTKGAEWTKLSRDLIVDLQKGFLSVTKSKRKISRNFLVTQFFLNGSGSLANMTLRSSDHESPFFSAADWFFTNQDSRGGWQAMVKRRIPGGADLREGWLSAMGQGHGISVLCRAFALTKNRRYLQAAMKALTPFRVTSSRGGVLARFMNKYPWYEEYPTQPPSFVLNGFMYALIGLYDLSVIGDSKEAKMLYERGLESLKALLLAFDTGSGTTYDLRHLSVGQAPKLARWDYHATHINQLLLLDTLDEEDFFKKTAERWIGYMKGKRVAHN